MGRGRWIALVAAVAGVLAPGAAEAKRGPAPTATADWFTLAPDRPLRDGQIELVTRSAPPDAVTGGDVLIAVRGLRRGDRLAVRRNGGSVTAAFGELEDGERVGLVDGLRRGANKITAVVRRGRARKVATLGVRDHPVTGPVLSGPHQEPFFCETKQAGLGDPLDEDCSIAPRAQRFYRSMLSGGWRELADGAAVPSDVAKVRTAGGRTVPFVVRVETRTINRGITRMAVLVDPARGTPRWNSQLTYLFGESCGVGYHQGRTQPSIVLGPSLSNVSADTAFASVGGLEPRLARGDLVVHSTMSAFGVLCNPLVSVETLMMVKEHVAETLGEPRRTLGIGGSGGALQQYNAVNNAPGLLDGAMPIASFTDVLSTAMTVVDCGLLLDYWGRTALPWSDDQKRAVADHRTTMICSDWRDLFLPNLDPREGCSSAVPDEVRYDRERNPKGVRCTLQDATVNIWGRDPATGFARRPYDNRGVQYGLEALNRGAISAEQFVDLNREVGGYDLDGRRVAQRSVMDDEVAERAYRLGGVIGRGALDRVPIIDLATYIDLVPILDIHDHVRPFQVRDRLRARLGRGDGTMSIWRGVSLPADAYPAMDAWMAAVERRGGEGDPRAVAAEQPAVAADRCVVGGGTGAAAPGALYAPFGVYAGLLGETGVDALATVPVSIQLPGRTERADGSVCASLFPALGTPRTVAGGPPTDDVLRCRLQPVDPADYRVPVDLDAVRAAFPDGVCDWSRPGVGEVRRSMQWVSLGGDTLREPRSLRWRIARSR